MLQKQTFGVVLSDLSLLQPESYSGTTFTYIHQEFLCCLVLSAFNLSTRQTQISNLPFLGIITQ